MLTKTERHKEQRKKGQGKQLTRREALKTLGAVSVLTPAASLLWEGSVQATHTGTDEGKKIGKLIDKVLTDPEFRKALKSRPIEVLAHEGIELPPETAEALTKAMKQDPDAIRALLGKPSPLLTDFNVAAADDICVIVVVTASVAVGVTVVAVTLPDP